MPHATKLATLLAMTLALAAPLAAQEATPEAAAPGADTAGDPADGLDMGTPIDGGEPAVGEAYTRETFGDWSMRCLNAAEGPDPCQLYQLLFDAEGNSVAEISMFPLPEGSRAAAGATIVAPLETLLTEQVVISVDGGTAKTYPFTFCNQGGCVARVGFTAEDIAAFKAGGAANLRIVPAVAPDQVVDLVISLVGFTAGYDFQVTSADETAAE
jgi:invasion protein IalB